MWRASLRSPSTAPISACGRPHNFPQGRMKPYRLPNMIYRGNLARPEIYTVTGASSRRRDEHPGSTRQGRHPYHLRNSNVVFPCNVLTSSAVLTIFSNPRQHPGPLSLSQYLSSRRRIPDNTKGHTLYQYNLRRQKLEAVVRHTLSIDTGDWEPQWAETNLVTFQ